MGMGIPSQLPQIISAIGGLGTAAFGLVDATKVFGGGVNRIGFHRIKGVVARLTPAAPTAGLSQAKIVDTLRANWYSGTDLASQKSIANTLIKQNLNTENAAALAAKTAVDGDLLHSAAVKTGSGTPLAQNETDLMLRFDFVVSALLDEAYQDADQAYTNGTRVVAAGFAIVLAFFGGWALLGVGFVHYLKSNELWLALIAGVLATPLAPVAKDLSSALASVVNSLQASKK